MPPCIPPAMQASCGSFQFYPILYFQLASLEYDNVCIIHDVETKAIRKLNITTYKYPRMCSRLGMKGS